MTETALTPSTAPVVAAIERLRDLRPADVDRPTVFQMRTVVNGLLACHALSDIARDAFGPFLPTGEWVDEEAAAEAIAAMSDKANAAALNEAREQIRAASRTPGLSGERRYGIWHCPVETVNELRAQLRVLDLVAEFGTWLTHVNGGSNIETVLGVDWDSIPLFQEPNLADSDIRPAAVKIGKKYIPFVELAAVEQARAIRLTNSQITAIATLVKRDGEDAGQALIEDIIIARERRASAQTVGQSAEDQLAAVKAARAANAVDEQLPLFGEPPARKRRRSRSRRAQATALMDTDTAKVIVPPGFERKAWHRRDVARALAAIVVTNPDDETIARFIARKYQTQAKVLTFQHLTLVWFFGQLGRLNEIDQINPKNPVLGQLLVEAYDLLEVARQDAIDALRGLAEAGRPGADLSDLDALMRNCTKASWLAEAELAKVGRLVAAVMARPSSEPALRRELSFLAQRLAANPSLYLPGAITELNNGQVRRIAAASGLTVEKDDRSEETEVRTALKDYGFSSDLDRLVPAGVQAIRAGLRDEFFEVMDARAAGNHEWHLLLDELFETIAA